MRRRIAAILLTAGLFWALIGETADHLITNLMGSRLADFIRALFREKETEESESPNADNLGNIDQWIEEAAEMTSLDPELIKAVIAVESGGNPNVVSTKGACGLMQLMPETSRMLKVDDPFDPRQNIIGGAGYLKYLLDEFGELDLALAAYNAGPMVVKRYEGIPPYQETQDYVRMVKKRLAELRQEGE